MIEDEKVESDKKELPLKKAKIVVQYPFKADLETRFPGWKVVVPTNLSNSNQRIRWERDAAKFGPDNIISEEECSGKEEKGEQNVKFGPKLFRNLCK